MSAAPFIRAVLVSVGGASAPILHVLRCHRPPQVWYFCSAGSRAVAEEIHSQLEWRPTPRFIEVERYEELGPCYQELRRKIPEILAESRIRPPEVLVDYTGGTKTMSAALVLVATEWFEQFSYVGGAQREKAGLGVVVDGREKVQYQANPWSELAIREIERAKDLWGGCQFEAAARILRGISSRVSNALRFEAIADLSDAMGARHRLDFRAANRLLSPLLGRLPSLFDGRNDHGLLGWVGGARAVCDSCSKDAVSEVFLRELLDNALRTAFQQRFEDAAARLYRAMEMQGQLWLATATRGLFVHGRCRAGGPGRLPAELQNLPFCQPDSRGEIRLSLEQCFKALAALGHDRATVIHADLVAAESEVGVPSRWRAATEKRNTGILAHGVQPIGRDGFDQMKQLAADFLGFDLHQEAHPIPPFDPRWLE